MTFWEGFWNVLSVIAGGFLILVGIFTLWTRFLWFKEFDACVDDLWRQEIESGSNRSKEWVTREATIAARICGYLGLILTAAGVVVILLVILR